jgi:soluble lytic murein transglycosylase-like protein
MWWLAGLAVGGTLLGIVSIPPHADARVWLQRDQSGTLHLSNIPGPIKPTVVRKPEIRYRRPIPRRPFLLRPARVSVLPTRYDDLISSIAGMYDVEFALVKAVIRAESNFNPRAISPKGARGLMQLMPMTARRHGVRNIHAPMDNIMGGVEHLRMLLDRYTGNVPLALAAYNAGAGAVEKAGNRIPRYPETQEYVRRVLEYRLAYLRDAHRRSVATRQ